jgi:ankyrin repeat protein
MLRAAGDKWTKDLHKIAGLVSAASAVSVALASIPAYSQEIQLKPFDPNTFNSQSNNLLIKPAEQTAPNPQSGGLQLKPFTPGLLETNVMPATVREMQKPQRARYTSVINEGDILSNTLNGPSPPEGMEIVYHKPHGQYATVKTADDIRLMKVLMYGTAEAKAEAVKKVLASPSKFTPPLLLAVSKNMMEQGKKDDAVFWYLAGYLRLRYDRSRCADDSVGGALRALAERFLPVQYIRENPLKIEPLLQQAMDWDLKSPYEYDYRWINMHGLKAFGTEDRSDPLSFPQSEWPVIRERIRKSMRDEFTGIAATLKAKTEGRAATTSADEEVQTPLHDAASRADLGQINKLLAQGASAKAATKTGLTPLHLATQYGMSFTADRMMARSGYKPPKSAESDKPAPTTEELEAKALPCVEALLRAGANPNAADDDRNTPLINAATNGYTNICKTLLAQGANVNVKDWNGTTALQMAAREGQLELCKALIAAGAEIDASSRGNTPLLFAAAGPYPEVVELLLSKGANPKVVDVDGETTLMRTINAASRSKDVLVMDRELKTATLLLKAGVDPNQGSQFFGTPLPSAVKQGNLSLVSLLLERGATTKLTAADIGSATEDIKSELKKHGIK